jgi:hypothetical protein
MAIKLDACGRTSQLRPLLHDYAVKVNHISDTLGRTLGTIYCATGGCDRSTQDPGYVPLSEIGDMIHGLDEYETNIVSELARATR